LHIITDVSNFPERLGVALVGVGVALSGAALAFRASFEGTILLGAIATLAVGAAGPLLVKSSSREKAPADQASAPQSSSRPSNPNLVETNVPEHKIFFLSYSRSLLVDKKLVDEFMADLQRELQAQHHRMPDSGYRDLRDIEIGSEFQQEIADVLDSCTAVVALLSPEFTTSVWCRKECEFARGRKARVLPLYWSGRNMEAVIPAWLRDLQYDTVGFGPEYHKQGLRRLCQDSDQDYRNCIRTVAARLDQLDSRPRYSYRVRPSLWTPA
jgi:hypothetical protein